MDPIYLDHAAATPLRAEVREAMAPFQMGITGNPSSVHRWGRAARGALEDARDLTATLLGVASDDVRFVRGGTESINLAILGRAAAVRESRRTPGRYLRSSLEHSAVRDTLAALERSGASVEVISIDRRGALQSPLGEVLGAAPADLVTIQWVNHETGMILPVPEVARACATAGVLLHVDAVQAAGRISLALSDLPPVFLSLSGHKIAGPPGSGVLVAPLASEIAPILFGGGQEGGLRPGTEDVAGAVGLARALELAESVREDEVWRLKGLRDRLERELLDSIPGLRIHGGECSRAPHILSVGVPGLPRDLLPGALDLEGLAVSAGSACRSGSLAVSPVLEALYGEEAGRFAPLRLSLGWTTTEAEVVRAAQLIPPVVERMWEAGVGA